MEEIVYIGYKNYRDYDDMEINTMNNMFEPYGGNNVNYSRLKALLSAIKVYNSTHEYQINYHEIEIKPNTTYDVSFGYNSVGLIKEIYIVENK